VKAINANELESSSYIDSDICIVGAGAAGITVARELDGSRHTVCLLESGDFGPDEATQSLYDLEVIGYPVRENFMSRARYFGGTCNLWAGRNMKLTQLDLMKREWIPNSGWPISWLELDRYCCRAGEILNLPSFEAFQKAELAHRMSQSEKSLLDNQDLRFNISMWAKKPLRFGTAYRARLKRSRNISVYLNTNVTEAKLNQGGTSVEKLTAVTLSGKKLNFRAKCFVLACGGLENARLLLVSRGVQSNGVGNQYDTVGRYFMDHPRAVFGRVKLYEPQRLPLFLGIPLTGGMTQLGLGLAEGLQRREELLNNYLSLERQWSDRSAKAYQSFVHSMKVMLRKGYSGKRYKLLSANLAKVPELIYLLAPRELMPHFLYSAFRTVKEKFNKGVTDLTVVNYCEQIPRPDSRVFLSHERDQIGMNRLVLDWKIGAEERRSLMRLHELLDCHLRQKRMGYLDNRSSQSNELSFSDASHHVGTTRMSDDPREGVVDKNCKVHGIDNLFIAGSSVFPTSGHANPTLTIVALALRLAERLNR
jgi:choline dehydrogenase-like flavoprotein